MQRILFLTLLLLACGLAQAQTASLKAPEQATIGSNVEVHWTGPGEQYDPIYLVASGADEEASALRSTSIVSGKNPVLLVMPDEPGVYEIRYASGDQVVARRPITVVEVPTSLSAPDTAPMGSELEVRWEGPGNDYERIELHEAGAADDAKAVAQAGIISRRNPVRLHLPERPGRYELRYKTRQSHRTLATRPLTLEAVETSISAPAAANVGAEIEVFWEGLGNQYDQIALYEAGAADDAKAVAQAGIISRRNPVRLRLPDQAGAYELRYLTARSDHVLARRPLRVGAVEASLEAPERAAAATSIAVTWQGPGNDYDQVAVFEPDASDDAKPLATQAILGGRNPVVLRLPEADGRFELRYRTAQSGTVLARKPILIEPAGRLAVVFERDGTIVQSQGAGAVELILDASGSMLQREGGTRRIETARTVLDELVREHLGADRAFALRVFGHRETGTCRTDLEIPLGPLDREAAAARIASINAMNLAKTPIAASLAAVPSDLAAADGPKTVILITDGEETCEGNPAAVIQDLRSGGLDVQVSVVGFAIDDADLQATFEAWAELGGGSYFDARSADELSRSLRTVISGPFRVLDAEGAVVGHGIIGGAEIVLPAGTYRVETVGSVPQVIEEVDVKPQERTEVAF